MINFRKSVLAVSLSLIGVCAFAAEKIMPMSYEFKQATMGGQKEFADPGFKKLTDGITDDKKKSCVMWHRKQVGKSVVVTFNFSDPVKLTSAKVYLYRGPTSFLLNRIAIDGIDDNDASIPLGYIDPKLGSRNTSGENFPVFEIPLDSAQAFSQVNLRVAYDSHFALTEVEFFGEKGEKKASVSMNPYPDLANQNKTGLKLTEKDVTGDSSPELIMENDRVIYVVEPVAHGVVNFAYDKAAGVNFIKPGSKDEHGGMFYDRFYPSGKTAFRESEYAYKIIENSKDKIVVEVSANGKGGMFDEVTLTKTFTLKKDSAALQADYTVASSQANVVPLNVGLWISSAVESKEKFDMIYHGQLASIRKPATEHDPYSSDPLYPWCAIMSESNKGLALVSDYEIIKRFIFWGNNPAHTTMETQMGVYEIKAADKFETTTYLVPFHGIGYPDNITANLAGRLDLTKVYENAKNTLNLKLFPVQEGKYKVKIFAAPVNKDKPEFKLITEKELVLTDKIEEIPFEMNFTEPGTWVFKVTAEKDGTQVYMEEAVTAFKAVSLNYALQPPAEKRPENLEQSQSMDLNFNSMEYVTPHYEWAKPYAGGKPKVLLVGEGAAVVRDMIEVAQRCDIDLTANFIGGVYSISGLYSSLSVSSCFNQLAKRFTDKYDVIVVTGDVWKIAPEAIKNSILQQVKEGTGLFLTSPSVGVPASIASRFKIEKSTGKPQAWSVVKETPVTAGVPVNALPSTIVMTVKTSDEVLMKAGNDPLLTTFNLEKGKVIIANWKTNTSKDSPDTVLPQMLYSLPKNVDYPYWEYQMSLVGKIIYYLSGKDSNVALNKITADADGKFKTELTAAKAQKVSIELTIADKFHNKMESVSKNIDLKAGTNEIEIPFKPSVMNGLIFADMIVKSDAGVETWGTSAFENATASYITAVSVPGKVLKPEDSVTVDAKITAPVGEEVLVQIYDSYGNEFARESKPAAADVSFSVPLKDCKAYTFDVLVSLKKDGKTIDMKKETRALYGVPDTRIFQFAFGWPSISTRSFQPYMMKYNYLRFKDMGATVIRPHSTDSEYELMEGRKTGIPYIYSRAPMSCDARFQKAGGKTKFDLIRRPCISKPGFKDAIESGNSKPSKLEEYGSIIRGGPDEANSIKKWDGCFSPDCQNELREYLKKQYGTLEALNKSWKTSFAKWEDVIAMTSEEVKKHPSLAPWLDHRSFNDWNRADAINRIAKGTKKCDPMLNYSLSGTHDTNPFNAYDWYLLMKSFDAIESYSGQQSVMQRCFHDGKLIWMPWLGYDSNFDSVNGGGLSYLMEGATAFSIFSGKFYINPDLTLPKRGQELKKFTDLYKNGPAELLINSKYKTYPIAFHYSPASNKADWALGWDDSYKSGVAGFANIVYSLGFVYDYIAYEQLETTNRLAEKYKVFFLPGSSAVSPKEVETIKAFVNNGGTVIADMLPAVYDQHGCPYEVNPLLDLFGVKDMGKLTIANAVVNGADATVDGLTLKGYMGKVKSFSMGIEPSTGKAIASTSYQEKEYPAVIINKYGKGRAIYFGAAMNSELGELSEMRFSPSRKAHIDVFTAFVDKLINEQGIKPEIKVVRPDGENIRVSRIVSRTNGPAIMFAVMRAYRSAMSIDGKPLKHKIELPGNYYIYDLVDKKSLGSGSSFEYEFAPQTQALFAILPYKVKNVDLKIQRIDRQVKVNVHAAADAKDVADHIFRIEIVSPSGKVSEAFSTMLFGKGLDAAYEFMMPYNAEPGDWKINVTDSLSGVSASEIIKVK